MIDEEWLSQLDFAGHGGMRIKGLVGLGSKMVTLGVTAPDGKECVLQTYRHHLGYHIREIPLLLTPAPLYDINKLNRKLLELTKVPYLDEITCEYDRMYSSIISLLHAKQFNEAKVDNPAVSALLMRILGHAIVPCDPEAFHFIFSTPALTRRLQEIASLPPTDENDPASYFAEVNGPNFSIEGMHDEVTEWAKAMLAVQSSVKQHAPYEPNTLASNPLFVWGAAVMDGFVTDEEMPVVVEFIHTHFGRLTSHPRIVLFLEQIGSIANLLACVLKQSKVARLVEFCGKLNLMFEVYDREGKIVASSMKR